MKHLVSLLTIALAAGASSLHAQEVHMTFSGEVMCAMVTAPACGPYPFVVSFDINAQSGQQGEMVRSVNGVPSVVGFNAANLQITNFEETIGGQRASVASAGTGLSIAPNPGGVPTLGSGALNFVLNSAAIDAPPAAGFTLANYLMRYNGLMPGQPTGFNPGLANTTGQYLGIERLAPMQVTVPATATSVTAPVSAPEPGMLALLLTSLAGLGFARRKRGLRTPRRK